MPDLSSSSGTLPLEVTAPPGQIKKEILISQPKLLLGASPSGEVSVTYYSFALKGRWLGEAEKVLLQVEPGASQILTPGEAFSLPNQPLQEPSPPPLSKPPSGEHPVIKCCSARLHRGLITGSRPGGEAVQEEKRKKT